MIVFGPYSYPIASSFGHWYTMGTGCQNGGKVQITTISPPIWPLSSVAFTMGIGGQHGWKAQIVPLLPPYYYGGELGGKMGEKPKLHPFYPPITMGPSRTVLLAPEGRQGGGQKIWNLRVGSLGFRSPQNRVLNVE